MNENVICWFEIYVKDMERAKQFYTTVLGIQFSEVCPGPGASAGDMLMSFFSSKENQGVSGALIYMPGTKEGDGKSVNTMVYFRG
jgi:predicted enzyme related to lactoylglutathione lyase